MSLSDQIWFLDLATQAGIAEGIPGEKPRLYTVRFAREFDESEDVFGRATLWIAERLAVSVPRAVYIEAALGAGAAWGHTNAKTSERLIGLWAAIAGVVRARGIPCRRANVKTIRKFFAGQGNLPSDKAKREVMRICRCLGWDPANFDEADAAAGWHFACSLHDKSIEPPRAHWTPISMSMLLRPPKRSHQRKPPSAIAPTPVCDASTHVDIMGLKASMCKWPIGDPATPSFAYCGAQRMNVVAPYCQAHSLLAYTPRGLLQARKESAYNVRRFG